MFYSPVVKIHEYGSASIGGGTLDLERGFSPANFFLVSRMFHADSYKSIMKQCKKHLHAMETEIKKKKKPHCVWLFPKVESVEEFQFRSKLLFLE